jgi:uncharacterized protein (TIGR02594 family)
MPMDAIDLQRRLRAAGLYHGALDGIIGPLTRAALKSFQAANNLALGDMPSADVALLARIPLPALTIPPWLKTMRDHLGLAEVQGPGSNPAIIALAKRVAEADPRLVWIGDFYHDDAIPWCGLMEAFCMVEAGIAPPLPNPLSARAWGTWGIQLPRPIPGAVLAFTRPGGGHVGLYEAEDETHYLVIAGNQGDRVSKERIPKSRILKDDAGQVIGVRWPATVPVPPNAVPVVIDTTGTTATSGDEA